MTDTARRAVLTLALGQPVYIQMAANLARSFRYWHRRSDIRFAVATDQPEHLPPDVREGVETVPVDAGQYGTGFSPKLHMDKLAPAEETLFIDADCLVAGSLEPVFERFDGHEVSVIGQMMSSGEWWGDIATRRRKLDVAEVPVFVGGVYYLRKSTASRRVYETARELEARYEELGMVKLRGVPNEEPLVSLGMALHGQRPVPDDGSIKADAMCFPSGIEFDVFEGHSVFRNNTDREFSMLSLQEARPVIGHFNDRFAERDPYTHEATRLRKVLADGWPLTAAGAYAKARHTLPQHTVRTTKEVLRPLYHRIFGTREVTQSARFPD